MIASFLTTQTWTAADAGTPVTSPKAVQPNVVQARLVRTAADCVLGSVKDLTLLTDADPAH